MTSLPVGLQAALPQVPANRIGYSELSLKLDDLWAALCIMAAVYFVFRS